MRSTVFLTVLKGLQLLTSIRFSNATLADEEMFRFEVEDVTISFSFSGVFGDSLLLCFGVHLAQLGFHLRENLNLKVLDDKTSGNNAVTFYGYKNIGDLP